MKVAAYSATAAWVAGIFAIVPSLAMLSILGLYSLYLLYLGLSRLMKAPEEKALAYTAVTIVAAIVLAVIIGAVRSEEHTSELQSLMRISYAVLCLQQQKLISNYT